MTALLDRAAHNQQIVNYYDQNYRASRFMWTNGKALALHFGYWEETTRTDFEAQLNTNRQLALRAGLKPGQKVLDAGCGIGGSSIWLAETYGVEVLGITISADQVRRATDNASQRGMSRLVKFSQQDYTRIDVAAGSFDVVWALESVSCALVKREFFNEAFRVLKPGGRVTLSDGFRRQRPFATPAEEALMAQFLRGWALPDLATPDELITPAKEAGFEEVRFQDESKRAEPSMRRLYEIGRWTAPLARVLGALKLVSPFAVQCAQGSRDQYLAYQRGLCGYAFLSARKPAV
jgi:cyclopropane fatty-acyl-phospholipid synthase-like methyltransferase